MPKGSGEKGGVVHTGNGHVMAIDLGMSKDSTNKCSLPASNDKGQKASYIKTECAYMKSFCVCLGIPAPSSSLKCLYTNACGMGNKQEELEIPSVLRAFVLLIKSTLFLLCSPHPFFLPSLNTNTPPSLCRKSLKVFWKTVADKALCHLADPSGSPS